MNSILWNVMVKHGYEQIFPTLIKEQCKELQLKCQIYANDSVGKDLVILIDLNQEERTLFEDTLTFACIKKLIHQMCFDETFMDAIG